MPTLFCDAMVLQRRQPVPVWGWAPPGQEVTVRFSGQRRAAVANAEGRWEVLLAPMEAGGPFNMEISSTKGPAFVIKNVLIGEVWVCSGQSNMEWAVAQSKDAEKEIKSAHDALIRHFKVPHAMALSPRKDLTAGQWEVCSPSTVGNFTAVGYFFAQKLRAALDIPVGLINTSWGGTMSETWTSREALTGHPDFKDILTQVPLDLDAETERLNRLNAPLMEAVKSLLIAPDTLPFVFQPDLDDSRWLPMQVPGYWKGDLMASFDGAVWFRRSFTMPSDWPTGQTITLSLGPIDDWDDTYLNGVKVGSTKIYNKKRLYTIPNGLLRPGRNLLSVRVNDTGGGGGLYGQPEEIFLSVGDQRIPLHGTWKYKIEAITRIGNGIGPNDYPTLLYNAMIHPLIPFAMKGVIWYQGESNAGRSVQYRQAFPLMIRDWRKQWGQGDFPFLFVQLANFKAEMGNSNNGGSNWAELREAQTMTLQLPNTGMAVTTDIGDTEDIHPVNKQDVGRRLAAQALHIAYGKKKKAYSPLWKDMKIQDNKAVLSFHHATKGLKKRPGTTTLQGFEIAGEDRRFVPAHAVIRRKKVVVSAPEVSQPLAVRYGWCDDPKDANLCNGLGLPVVPFRTDTWPGKTDGVKYQFILK